MLVCGMRIAIVSDIHGNLTALEAVLEDLKRTAPDLVVQGGDLPASGSRPAAVIDRVRGLGWPSIQGNTDEMLWRPELLAGLKETNAAQVGLWTMVEEMAAATLEMIGTERLRWLRSLPTSWRNETVAVVHASLGDLWQAPLANAPDEKLEETYAPLEAATVVYGHIHHPFVRRLASFTVVNCGSVSLSYDGDARASYAVIDAGKVEIRRVSYDVEQEIRELKAAGYPHHEWIADWLRAAALVPPRISKP